MFEVKILLVLRLSIHGLPWHAKEVRSGFLRLLQPLGSLSPSPIEQGDSRLMARRPTNTGNIDPGSTKKAPPSDRHLPKATFSPREICTRHRSPWPPAARYCDRRPSLSLTARLNYRPTFAMEDITLPSPPTATWRNSLGKE